MMLCTRIDLLLRLCRSVTLRYAIFPNLSPPQKSRPNKGDVKQVLHRISTNITHHRDLAIEVLLYCDLLSYMFYIITCYQAREVYSPIIACRFIVIYYKVGSCFIFGTHFYPEEGYS